MRTIILLIMLGAGYHSIAQKSDFEYLARSYARAGDDQDANTLERLTHPDFRIIWHDGQKEQVSNVPRQVYLQKISSKEWGGDKRKVVVGKVIQFDEVNASVQLEMIGEKAGMKSILALVNIEGDWKVVQELVTAEFFTGP